MEIQISNWRRLCHTGNETQGLQYLSQMIEKRLHLSRIECVALCAQKQSCRYVSHQKNKPKTCLTFSSYNVDDDVLDIRASNNCIYSNKQFQGQEQRFLVEDVISSSEDVSITYPEQGSILATSDGKEVSSVPDGGDGEASHCKCIHPQYKRGTIHALPNIFTLQHQDEKTYLQAFDFAKETFITLNIKIDQITDIAVDVDDGVVYIVEKKSPVSMVSLSKFCCDGSSKITLATFKGSWLIASDPILDSVFYVRVPLRRGKPRIIMLNVNTRTEQVITKLQKMSKLIGVDFVNHRIYWIGPQFNNRLRIMSMGYGSRNDKVKPVVSLPQHTRERYWLFAATYPIITWCATDDSAKQYFMGRKKFRTVTSKTDICRRVGRMKNGFFVIWRAAYDEISTLMLYDQHGNVYNTIPLPSHDIFLV